MIETPDKMKMTKSRIRSFILTLSTMRMSSKQFLGVEKVDVDPEFSDHCLSEKVGGTSVDN